MTTIAATLRIYRPNYEINKDYGTTRASSFVSIILQPINRRIVYRIVFFCSHQLEYHESQHPITKHSSGSVYVYAE